MNYISSLISITIYILNFFYIKSIKFTLEKIISKNSNSNIFDRNITSLLNNEKISLSENRNIPISSINEGLYTISLNIGTPPQILFLLLDTGSSLLWVNNMNCLGCKSKNKFISSESHSFQTNNKVLNINYLSGEISGIIGIDTIKLNSNNYLFNNFSFLLINKTNINIELDGIFGLSKGVRDTLNLEFSVMYQIYQSQILKKHIFLLDFSKNNFYIGELPSYLEESNHFYCKTLKDNFFNRYYWNCIFEKIKINNENIITSNNLTSNYIIFDSGINGLIFPLNYILAFENLIYKNKLLKSCDCSIKNEDKEKNIYTIICVNSINNLLNGENKETTYNNEEFISIYISNDKKLSFKLSDLYHENDKSFKIYFTLTPNNAIFLGIPFFEKYIILLDKDNDKIIIYDEVEENNNNSLIKGILKLIIIIILLATIILICFIIIRKRRKFDSSQIEKKFSNFGELYPENSAINNVN